MEKLTLGERGRPWRWIVAVVGRPLDLATSRCERTLGRDGRLTEIVWLSRSPIELSEAELERFVAQFPITNSYR